jgi:hypothetical protein
LHRVGRHVLGYPSGKMRRFLWLLAITVAAFVGGVAGFLPVFVIGLGVPLTTVGPLAIGTGALVASLAAGWVGNLAAPQRTRSRLLAILVASEIGAILFSLISVALWAFAKLSALPTPSRGLTAAFTWAMLFCLVVFVFVVPPVATWRYRAPGVGRLGYEGAAALALSVVGLIVLVLTVPVFGSGFSPGELLSAIGSSANGFVAAGFVACLVLVALLAALGVVWAARASREGLEGHELRRDAALTLAVVGIWVAVVFNGTLFLTCAVVTCQP